MEEIDGEPVKKYDFQYARQVEALARLCRRSSEAGFRCNPEWVMALGSERLYFMGRYILDNQLRQLKAVPLMLTERDNLKNLRVPQRTETVFTHAILVRLPTEEEMQTLLLTGTLQPGQLMGCLELLRFSGYRNEVAGFKSTGVKELYIER